MSSADEFRTQIESRFGFLKQAVILKRPGRITIELSSQKDFAEVFDYLVEEAGFSSLLAITGLDELQRYGVIYHLFSEKLGILNLKTPVDKQQPRIQTVTSRFEQADMYERELADLLGIQIQGLPPGQRYPLPDNWPDGQYPLRKDWKGSADLTAEENSHG
jgi:membrane-bound hydrogenase subunit beta